ncbi:MAG TPA: hypothetical protein VJB65_04190 [Patescibacteria group bacterium]|nr:hypothetical protein [Patescibacteria group bacterium]
MTSVKATKKGYKVVYSDGSEKAVKIYKNDSDNKTKVKYYADQGLVLVLQSNGKKLALVNVQTGKVIKKVQLADNTFNQQSLKIAKIQNKKCAVITLRGHKREESKVVIVRLNLHKQNITKKDSIKLSSTKLTVNKTEPKNKKVHVTDSNGNKYEIKVNADFKATLVLP